MLVHLVGSRYNVVENIAHLRNLAAAIHAEGHTLASDWIESAYGSEMKGSSREEEWQPIYKESVDALNRADAVVADATIRGFGIGYQVSMAVQMKKPTLVLFKKGVEDSSFASGIDVGVTFKEYTENNVADIIKDFLRENDIQTKDMRFNFFIDRPIYNYLRWAAHKTGKTKAEILRDLVAKEIERQNGA
jgi:hypothetical protein